MAGNQQHAAQKNIAFVGIGAELVVKPPFGLDRQVLLAQKRFVGLQRYDDFLEVLGNDADGLLHDGEGQIGVRTVVEAIDESGFGGQMEFEAGAGDQGGSQTFKFGKA